MVLISTETLAGFGALARAGPSGAFQTRPPAAGLALDALNNPNDLGIAEIQSSRRRSADAEFLKSGLLQRELADLAFQCHDLCPIFGDDAGLFIVQFTAIGRSDSNLPLRRAAIVPE